MRTQQLVLGCLMVLVLAACARVDRAMEPEDTVRMVVVSREEVRDTLIPKPTTLRFLDGPGMIPSPMHVRHDPDDAGARGAAGMLEEQVPERVRIHATTDLTPRWARMIIRPADPPLEDQEAYRLTVDDAGVVLEATGADGFLAGARRVMQLMELSPDARTAVRFPAFTVEEPGP